MRQRVHLITLGVDDVPRATAFYEALGWRQVESPDGIVVFDLFGATLGLYPREMLARDIGGELPPGSGSLTLSNNTRSKGEVDAFLARAKAAGADILREAHDLFWGGYGGYFRDPEGHIWEVCFNPFSPLGANDEFQWNGA